VPSWSSGIVYLDIYVSYKQVLLITYTDGHWRQTYWHTSMADCYDINDYQLTLFCLHLVKTFYSCHVSMKLPSRSISWVKLLLVACTVISFSEWIIAFLLWNHILTSRPCLIPKNFGLFIVCQCSQSSAFGREVEWSGVVMYFWLPTVWLCYLNSPYICIDAYSSPCGTIGTIYMCVAYWVKNVCLCGTPIFTLSFSVKIWPESPS